MCVNIIVGKHAKVFLCPEVKMSKASILYLQPLNQILPAVLPLQTLPAWLEQSFPSRPTAHSEAIEKRKRQLK